MAASARLFAQVKGNGPAKLCNFFYWCSSQMKFGTEIDFDFKQLKCYPKIKWIVFDYRWWWIVMLCVAITIFFSVRSKWIESFLSGFRIDRVFDLEFCVTHVNFLEWTCQIHHCCALENKKYFFLFTVLSIIYTSTHTVWSNLWPTNCLKLKCCNIIDSQMDSNCPAFDSIHTKRREKI